MTTTRITPDQDTVVSEIDIAAPPARVFQALTIGDELKRWFTSPECPAKSWQMDPRLGGHYGYATEKGSFQVNGITEFECHGEILEYDPPRVLAYTWLANWHEDVRAPHHRPLGTRAHQDRHACESHAQRPGAGKCSPQGLFQRLARRGRNAEEVRRANEMRAQGSEVEIPTPSTGSGQALSQKARQGWGNPRN
jgi:uncharacterized protein YndB with AHSA1/START domain